MQVLEITRENARNFAPFIGSEAFLLIGTKGVFAIGATQEEEPVAALIAIEEDGVLLIQNLYVSPDYRRRGFGSALIAAAIGHAYGRLTGVRGIYCLPEKTVGVADAFYMHSGFTMPVNTAETVFTASIRSLKDSYLYAHRVNLDDCKGNGQFFPFFRLPAKTEKIFLSQSGKEIPSFMNRENTKGTPLPDLSLVYATETKIGAFAVFTDVEGELCLNFAYSSRDSVNALLAILSEAYRLVTDKPEYQQYQSLKIVAVNEPGLKIITKLCEGSDIHGETIRETYYPIPNVNPFLQIPGNAICEPKLNTLAPTIEDMLSPNEETETDKSEEASSVRLVLPDDDAPYLTFPVAAAERTVWIHLYYTVLEPETQDAFVLSAESEIDFPGISDLILNETIRVFNENSLTAFAIRGTEEHSLLIKAGLPEGAVPDEASERTFIRLFVQGIRDIVFYLSE
jgi:GNAT superfamily N-acetyltransferase